MTRSKLYSLFFVVLAGIVTLSLAWNTNAAEVPGDVARLEAELFDRVLSSDEVDGLLKDLEKPETREAATKTLMEKGQGHQERIIRFAKNSVDIEARQACTDVIEALDASYRTTELGKRLGAIYQKHAGDLLPSYWARFRKDPCDLRAVALLMYADPELVYKWLGEKKNRESRYDQVRYLLLRFRESPTDTFFAKHIDEHTAASITRNASDVFPIECWNQSKFGGFQRIVGNSGLKYFTITPQNLNTGIFDKGPFLLKIQHVEIHARQVFLYRHENAPSNVTGICVGRYTFSPEAYAHRPGDFSNYRYDPKAYWRPVTSTLGDRLLAPLPVLKQKSYVSIHAALPYLPKAYRGGATAEETRPSPEQLPSEALEIGLAPRTDLPSAKKPLDPSLPTVVILRPRLVSQFAGSYRTAAEGLCDRIEQEITSAGLARVVNRTELDRIFQERRLDLLARSPATGSSGKKPVAGDGANESKMLSYDAMLRVEMVEGYDAVANHDDLDMKHKIEVSLIDLSTGNEIGSKRFNCPMSESDVKPLRAMCCEGLKVVGRSGVGLAKDKLKVRLLWRDDADAPERLARQGRELAEVFRESLARSKKIVVVEHLEAGSAEEESLLLLMGLSRLAGERQFTPQADATIELRLAERDAAGKTFEQTPVEVAFRVRKERGYQGDWVTTRATVTEFQTLLRDAWVKLAKTLDAAETGSVADVLGEMSLRRKQAKAELAAAKAIEVSGARSLEQSSLLQRLAHIQAARKLDPTSAEAAIEEVGVLEHLGRYSMTDARVLPEVPNIHYHVLRKSLDFLQRFPEKPEFRARAVSHAFTSLYGSELFRLHWCGEETLHGVGQDECLLSPEAWQALADTEKILRHAVSLSGHVDFENVTAMTVCVHRGMRLRGVPVAERQAWLEDILKRCNAEIERWDWRSWRYDSAWSNWYRLQLRAAQLMLEDGNEARAREIVEQVMARPIPTPVCKWGSVFTEGRLVMVHLDDLELLERYEAWLKNSATSTVRLMELRWPNVDPFHDQEPVGVGRFAGYHITTPVFEKTIAVRHAVPDAHSGAFLPVTIAPLVEVGDRLYVLTKKAGQINWASFDATAYDDRSQGVAYIPLDKQGRPVGRQTGPKDQPRWENLHTISDDSHNPALLVTDHHYVDGKLVLGTFRSGLLIFDTRTEKWSTIGTAEGLPAQNVQRIWPLDKNRLFVVQKRTIKVSDYSSNHDAVCCEVDLSSKKVTLLYEQKEDYLMPRFFLENDKGLSVWNQFGKMNGPKVWYKGEGIVNPFSDGGKKSTWRPSDPYGWPSVDYERAIMAMTQVGDRVFCTTENGGFHECDPAGKILRSWWQGKAIGVREIAYMSVPPNSPMQVTRYGGKMIRAGELLIFISDVNLVAYDPKADVWYGPVRLHGTDRLARIGYAYATPQTLWLVVDDEGLERVAIEDLLARAREVGRALTSEQYLQKRQALIDALEPVEQAKVYFSMRQFDKAEATLDKILATDPNRPEALLLAGWVHDFQPKKAGSQDEALAYFRRLAKVHDPSASLTGHYCECDLLRRQKRWKEADAVLRQITRHFPRIDNYTQETLDRWLKQIRKNAKGR